MAIKILPDSFDPAAEGFGTWSPDGLALIFSSNRKGHYGLYRKSRDGTGAEELLYEDAESRFTTSWSPDGEFLLYTVQLGGWREMRVLPLTPPRPGATRTPYPWAAPGTRASLGQFSPNGKWIVYTSREAGQVEVNLAPFPGPGGTRQVSPAGGNYPRWRRDGKRFSS